MIIDNKNKTCTITEKDLEETCGSFIPTDDICMPIIRSMLYDIAEDIERGMDQYGIKIDHIDSEGYFEMAYEMFETCYYSYIKDTIVSILDKAEII